MKYLQLVLNLSFPVQSLPKKEFLHGRPRPVTAVKLHARCKVLRGFLKYLGILKEHKWVRISWYENNRSTVPKFLHVFFPRSPINYDQATEDMVSTHIMTQHKRKILTLDQQQDSLLQSNLLKVCRAPKYFQKLIFSLKTLEIGKCLQRQQNATVLNASPFISVNFAQF